MTALKTLSKYFFNDLANQRSYPFSDEIKKFILKMEETEVSSSTEKEETSISKFFQKAYSLMEDELKEAEKNSLFSKSLTNLTDAVENRGERVLEEEIFSVFHPEAADLLEDTETAVTNLREKRKIRLTKLNPSPIHDPAAEIIFTSNFMLTIPMSEEYLDKALLSDEIKKELKSIMKDKQNYWFDHPVPAGIPDKNNELIYGLKNLAETLEYEKKRGNCSNNAKMTVIISVSVTHERLKNILHKYIEEELSRINNFKNLDIYIFTERDTDKILDTLLIPAAESMGISKTEDLKKVFGVDGEYGRHYTFLKAIAPLWNVLIDKQKKATFKIDLDQVFPEKELIDETGKSAFEHFKTPLWGAKGVDWKGRDVELGMIAGSLVNEKDISESIFKADVPYPEAKPAGEDKIFFKQLPMAVSTEAEMNLKKYSDSELCMIRYHVTGGTNGILIDHLRKYRPFTPTFIGRAEDQAYLFSVLLNRQEGRFLRYLHQPGLKMRHDKEAFASDAIKTAKTGTYVGDLVRIIAFSHYSNMLEKGVEIIKQETAPFTGSFISKIPFTLIFFKLLIHIDEKLKEPDSDKETDNYIENLITLSAERISAAVDFFHDSEKLKQQFNQEKNGWEKFYDIINFIENEINEKTEAGISFRKKGIEIMGTCKI